MNVMIFGFPLGQAERMADLKGKEVPKDILESHILTLLIARQNLKLLRIKAWHSDPLVVKSVRFFFIRIFTLNTTCPDWGILDYARRRGMDSSCLAWDIHPKVNLLAKT